MYESGHALSVIGYKELSEENKGNMLIQILNPWLEGEYLENNIKKDSEYKLLNEEEKKYLTKIPVLLMRKNLLVMKS